MFKLAQRVGTPKLKELGEEMEQRAAELKTMPKGSLGSAAAGSRLR